MKGCILSKRITEIRRKMSLFDEAMEEDFDDFDDLEAEVKPSKLPALSGNQSKDSLGGQR